MIITSGTLRFKRIKSINCRHLRPTSSKIRQAVFNTLLHKLEFEKWKKNNYILDVFAGTGIVSFEALSRGMLHSTLIEKNFHIYNVLLDNIKNLKIFSRTHAINEDLFNLKSLPYKYKLVFLDPPYNKNMLNSSLELIHDIGALKKNSILICETEKNFKFKKEFIRYLKHEKYYGLIKLSYLILN